MMTECDDITTELKRTDSGIGQKRRGSFGDYWNDTNNHSKQNWSENPAGKITDAFNDVKDKISDIGEKILETMPFARTEEDELIQDEVDTAVIEAEDNFELLKRLGDIQQKSQSEEEDSSESMGEKIKDAFYAAKDKLVEIGETILEKLAPLGVEEKIESNENAADENVENVTDRKAENDTEQVPQTVQSVSEVKVDSEIDTKENDKLSKETGDNKTEDTERSDQQIKMSGIWPLIEDELNKKFD